MPRLALGSVLVLAAMACRPEKHAAAPSASPEPSFATLVKSTLARMHQRYAAARTIEEAIVWGDLATAQSQGRGLSLMEEPDVLAVWQPYLERVRIAAQHVEASGTIASAARHSAELAAACAACHAASETQLELDTVAEPPPGDSVGAQMRAHAWGAARMWEGLIAPSEDRWATGAGALERAPIALPASEQSRLSDDMVAVQRAMADHLERVRDFANRATQPLSQPQRVELYGAMLETCASCHTLVRDVRLANQ